MEIDLNHGDIVEFSVDFQKLYNFGVSPADILRAICELIQNNDLLLMRALDMYFSVKQNKEITDE